MGTIKIEGQLIGTFQNEHGFFARFIPKDGEEIDIPISRQQFHGLIFREATLTLEIV